MEAIRLESIERALCLLDNLWLDLADHFALLMRVSAVYLLLRISHPSLSLGVEEALFSNLGVRSEQFFQSSIKIIWV